MQFGLVIDIFFYVASGTSPLYKFESNRTISYGDIAFWRFRGYKCHLAANAVVLVIGGYQISIAKYLRGVSTIKFERCRLNICRVRVFASSGSTGGRGSDAKTIICITEHFVRWYTCNYMFCSILPQNFNINSTTKISFATWAIR